MAATVFPSLVGRSLKDENGREIGRIISFTMGSSGEAEEVLIEIKSGNLVRYPVERLRVGREEVFLTSDIERRAEKLCESFPMLLKKREILDSLFKNREIMPEIYENLSAGLNKSIEELKFEAESLLGDIARQIQSQEELIKTLHLARAFLEIEHGVGNVKDDVFRRSLLSILREIKYASYRKKNLLKIRDEISNVVLQGDREEASSEEPSLVEEDRVNNEKPVINVRITSED